MTAPVTPLPVLPRTFTDDEVAEWLATDYATLAARAQARRDALLGEITEACTLMAVVELLPALPGLRQAAVAAVEAVNTARQVLAERIAALVPLDVEIGEGTRRVADYAAAIDTDDLDVTVLEPLAEKLAAAKDAVEHLRRSRTGPAALVDQAQATLRDAQRHAADTEAAAEAHLGRLRDPLHNAPDAWRDWLMRTYPWLLILAAAGAPVTEQDRHGAHDTHELIDNAGGIRAEVEVEVRREARAYAAQVRRTAAQEQSGYVLSPGGTIARLA